MLGFNKKINKKKGLVLLTAVSLGLSFGFSLKLRADIAVQGNFTGGTASDGRPPSYTSHRSTGTDPIGAQIKIAYDINPKEEVVVLDHHEGILSLDCDKANVLPSGRLELRVASASAFLDNLPEDALFSLGPGELISN